MDRTHTTQPIGSTGTEDWQGVGRTMLRDLDQFIPALKAQIDALPVGNRDGLKNLYRELSSAYETWCQQVGVGPGAFAGNTGKAAT